MPEPEAFEAFFCEIEQDENLPAVVDSLRRLALAGALRGTAHLINDVLYMAMLMPYPHEACDGQPCLSDDARRSLQSRHGLSAWTLTSGLYGSAAQVRANRALIRREFKPQGKLTFVDRRELPMLDRLRRFVKHTQKVPIVSGLSKLLKHWLIGRAPLELFDLIPNAVSLLQGGRASSLCNSPISNLAKAGPASKSTRRAMLAV